MVHKSGRGRGIPLPLAPFTSFPVSFPPKLFLRLSFPTLAKSHHRAAMATALEVGSIQTQASKHAEQILYFLCCR